jgi:hypothetical protein
MLKEVIAASALAATAFAAHAAAHDIGVLPAAPDTFVKGLTVGIGGGTFSDTFTFVAPHGGGYTGTGTVEEVALGPAEGLHILTIKLYDASHTLLSVGSEAVGHPGLESSSVTWSLLPGASYSFEVWGFTEHPFGGQYTFTASAALVPEPETLAMMLAGLLGVGFMARRRLLK